MLLISDKGFLNSGSRNLHRSDRIATRGDGMIDHGKQNLLGIGIDAVDYDAAVHKIVQAAKTSQQFGVSALAVHGIMTGVLDREHCFRLNQLEMVVPDGQPVRWGLNLIHRLDLRDRVYGPQLMLKVCEAAAQRQLGVREI